MTQTRYGAVVTDLDGTIVVDDGSVASGTVSTATLRAAAELVARGVPLIVATSRTPAGVRALGPLLPHLAGAVCCTGAVGWNPATGRIAWQDSIPMATIREVVTLVMTCLPGAGVAAYDGRRWALTEQYVSARGSLPRGPSEIVAGAAAIADRSAAVWSPGRGGKCPPGRPGCRDHRHRQRTAGWLRPAAGYARPGRWPPVMIERWETWSRSSLTPGTSRSAVA